MGCANSCQRQRLERETSQVEPAVCVAFHNAAFSTTEEEAPHLLHTEGDGKDAIAIVGIGCRTPGADNIQEFWRLLVNGECHVTDVPANRWNAAAFQSEDPTAVGKAYVQKGGFINDIHGFDNGLYGINDFEACQMDPQHCLLLECTSMALEDAGLTSTQLQQASTGVYIGSMNSDHGVTTSGFTSKVNSYSVTSNANSLTAARLSYAFNLKGPSLMVDTACSASLVAIHLACQAICSGDCDMAISGGVNCLLLPDHFILLSKARMVSPTGLCRTFSDQADGYIPGEGCGIVILKRLADAVRDGDHIWATICTGSNQDGRTVTPITAPSGEQQEKLLCQVYDKFNVDVSKLHYIEAHGTGTPTGDPVEVNSFGSFLKKKGQMRQRYIGSLKTNIGHAESASGVLSVIKLCLMMEYSTIVPSLHCEVVNPSIDLDDLQFTIPKDTVPWSDTDKLCCCNSFGFGGTNCHAILQSVRKKDVRKEKGEGSCIVCFSGESAKSLKGSMEDFIKDPETFDLCVYDVSYTSTLRREHHPYRASFLVDSMPDLLNKVGQRLSHDHWPLPVNPMRRKLIFVFCGMGTTWEGMCRQLLVEQPAFKETVMEVEKLLSLYVSWSLTERLMNEDPSKDRLFDPIAVFACQIGLVAVWRSLGIQPSCVVGQSVGEVAAAYTAGCFSLASAVKIIYHRSKLLAEETKGCMIIVRNVEVDKVRQVLKECDLNACVSQEYSSIACAVSAAADTIEEVQRSLQTKLKPAHTGMVIKKLDVSVAYHSPHVNHCAEQLMKQLEGMTAQTPSLPMQSTVSGKSVVTPPGAEYWSANIREPVLFKQAIIAAAGTSQKAVFLEIGPRPVLEAHLKDVFPNQKMTAVASMFHPPEKTTLFKAVISLYEKGSDIVWAEIQNKDSEPTRVPRYCFSKNYQAEKTEMDLLFSSGLDCFNNSHLYTVPVRDAMSYLLLVSPLTISSVYDHTVSGKIIVPGAVCAEAALAVARYMQMTHPAVSIEFELATPLKKDEVIDLIAKFKDTGALTTGNLPSLIIKRENQQLASAQLRECGPSSKEMVNLDFIKSRCKSFVDKTGIYSALAQFGFQYGPAYKLLEHAYRSADECLASLRVPNWLQREIKLTILHPSVLDCMLQSTAVLAAVQEDSSVFLLPKGIHHLMTYRPVESSMYVHTRVKQVSIKQHVYAIRLLSSTGQVIADISDFIVQNTKTEESVTTAFATEWARILDAPRFFQESSIQNPEEETHFLFVTDNDVIRNNLTVNWANMRAVTDVMKEIEEAVASHEPVSGLVFVCSAEVDGVPDGDTILAWVVRMCLVIQAILRMMKDMSLGVPFYVCTLNAWPSADENPDSAKTNPVATSLWGLVRSVLQERVHSSIRAVDLCLPSSLNNVSLPVIFRYLTETESVQHYPELMVTEDGVFANQVVKDNCSPLSCHLHKFADDRTVKNEKENDGKTAPVIDDNPHAAASDQSSYVLNGQEFLVGVDKLFGRKHQHKSERASEETTLALETKGLLAQVSESEMVCCCPVLVNPAVTVPAETVMPTSLMHDYELGDLSKLVVLWELCCSVQMQDFTILASSTTRHLAELMEMLCTALHDENSQSVNVVLLEEVESEEEFQANVVSLVYLDTDLTSFVIHRWQLAERLVTYTFLLSLDAFTLMTCDKSNTQLTLLDAKQIFHPDHLKKTVPQIQSWMRTCGHDMEDIARKLHQSVNKTKAGDLNQLFQFKTHTADSGTDAQSTDICFRKDASYVVVGGLTGLGWICVMLLARQNAGYIAIVNRSKPSAEKAEDINNLAQKYNCQIQTYQADVTSTDSVERMFSKIESTNFHLRGVFMGAAVLKDRSFLAMTADEFESVLCPKIKGAWNLHQLTKNIHLDYFVLHSSLVTILGNAGQANYATGNAFLDGLAWYRRHLRLPAQTINWGPLNTGLLLQQSAAKQKMESAGFHIPGSQEISNTLAAILCLKQTQTIPATMNPSLYVKRLHSTAAPSVKLRFQEFTPLVVSNDQRTIHSSVDITHVKYLDPEERSQAYELYVCEIVCRLLMLEISEVSCDTPLSNLGMDSMSGTTLLDHIQHDTTFNIPAVELFNEKATVKSLARVLDQYAGSVTDTEKMC